MGEKFRRERLRLPPLWFRHTECRKVTIILVFPEFFHAFGALSISSHSALFHDDLDNRHKFRTISEGAPISFRLGYNALPLQHSQLTNRNPGPIRSFSHAQATLWH